MKSKFRLILLCSIAAACSVRKNGVDEEKQIILLSSPSGLNSAEPFLFTDANRIAYLSWVEKKGDSAIFKYSQLRGNQWADPVVIASGNTWFVNWADYPMITANGNQLVAHFLDKSGESTYAYDIKLTTSDDNGKHWSTPKVLNDDMKKAEHGFVTLLPYGDNFFVTWLDGRNTVMEGMEAMDHDDGHHGSMSLRAAIIDPKGNKVSEWELDNKTCDCCQTSAAITTNGPVVVYRDRSDEEIRDMSIVRLINDQWTKPVSIHNDQWKIAGCPVNGPRVVANANNLAAIWFTATNDTSKVNVIFSSDGGATFGQPIRVDNGATIGRVGIVLLDDNSVFVSWMEGTLIKAARIQSNGTNDESITVASTSDARSSGFPQMTKSGNQLIFAWTDDKERNIKTAIVPL